MVFNQKAEHARRGMYEEQSVHRYQSDSLAFFAGPELQYLIIKIYDCETPWIQCSSTRPVIHSIWRPCNKWCICDVRWPRLRGQASCRPALIG